MVAWWIFRPAPTAEAPVQFHQDVKKLFCLTATGLLLLKVTSHAPWFSPVTSSPPTLNVVTYFITFNTKSHLVSFRATNIRRTKPRGSSYKKWIS